MPMTVTQVDVNVQDQVISRLCEIARQHPSSKTKAVAALLQAEPGLPEKDAFWLADYAMRTDGA